MRVSNEYKRKVNHLSDYDLLWLAREMIERVGQQTKSVSVLAREMKLWKSQVIKVGLTYPRTFEVYAENGTHKVRLR